MSSQAVGLNCKASKFPFNDSLIESKWIHIRAWCSFGSGTKFSLISVVNAKVPSEPANSLQKLNCSSAFEKGLVSANKSRA